MGIQKILKYILPLAVLLVATWLTFERKAGHSLKHRIGSLADLRLDTSYPDTTAVVLNWSRFSNVQGISALLCGPVLDGIISEVFVWNNSPQKISYDDFPDTPCRRSRLKIHNSPDNMYFHARFLACAQASTPYCFIQDDDYLIIPEAIHALHARIRQSKDPHTIHLLPAHEHLTSSLREIRVGNPSADPTIHTGFAWLGHGSFMHHAEVTAFLALMRALNASDSEMKMADNYFSILRNRVPDIWFDQGIELAGGRPFTVGVEGDERNNRHITRATEYLQSIIAGEVASADRLPFVRDGHEYPQAVTSHTTAICKDSRCLLETNIALLPDTVLLEQVGESATQMLEIAARNRDRLGAASQSYLTHPPSLAVDNRPETFFESQQGAKLGDFIQMDFFEDLRVLCPLCKMEMVWLIDQNTARVLRASSLKSSADGHTWCEHPRKITCSDVDDSGDLQKCVFALETITRHAVQGVFLDWKSPSPYILPRPGGCMKCRWKVLVFLSRSDQNYSCRV